ncbi:MAG: endolytic transglycosylase MltG [Neisseria sp.]|nr:endolytic transglycosylase MltG [Neisseria sp.]
MKKLLAWLVLLSVLAAAAWAFLLFYPKTLPENYHLKIEAGQGLSSVSRQLASDGVIYRREALLLAVRATGMDTSLHQGSYRLSGRMSAWQVLQRLLAGSPDTVTVRIVEGWPFTQIRGVLADNPNLQHRTAALSPMEILRKIDPDAPQTHPEGLLFPDTYMFADASDDLTVYRHAYRTMQGHLQRVWDNRADGLPYQNPYELLIMASIVEKETGLSAERDLVAAVFVNRLKIGMRLQTDPSVIYGMGEAYDGNIRKADLQRDTPYNTYTRAGLPPTPIAAPSLASLQAAAHPADVPYLYFVSKSDGSGESYFSRDLSEHNAAVRRYILKK